MWIMGLIIDEEPILEETETHLGAVNRQYAVPKQQKVAKTKNTRRCWNVARDRLDNTFLSRSLFTTSTTPLCDNSYFYRRRIRRSPCDIMLADLLASPSWTRGRWQRLLDGEVKIPGSRKRRSLRVRYVPFSIATEGELWAPRWLRRFDIREAR